MGETLNLFARVRRRVEHPEPGRPRTRSISVGAMEKVMSKRMFFLVGWRAALMALPILEGPVRISPIDGPYATPEPSPVTLTPSNVTPSSRRKTPSLSCFFKTCARCFLKSKPSAVGSCVAVRESDWRRLPPASKKLSGSWCVSTRTRVAGGLGVVAMTVVRLVARSRDR